MWRAPPQSTARQDADPTTLDPSRGVEGPARALIAAALLTALLACGGCRSVDLAAPDRGRSGLPVAFTPLPVDGAAGGTGGDANAPPLGPAAAVRAFAPRATVVRLEVDGMLVLEDGAVMLPSRRYTVDQTDAFDQATEPDPVARMETIDEVRVRRSRWQATARTGAPVGIAVRLHGLTMSPLDRRLDDALLERGWQLVHYLSLELDPMGFRPRPPGSTVEADVLASPTETARSIDRSFAQVAVAASRVLAAERARLGPRALEVPVVVIGTSLGGILAPAVAARLDDDLRADGDGLRALVLIGAGGDVGTIMATTPAMRTALPDLGAETIATWRAHMRGALDASRLDPLAIGPHLRHVPALMLHARFDAVVPADTGVRLWRALGRPDRWSYLAGHYGLLGLWTGEGDDVAAWVERTVRPTG